MMGGGANNPMGQMGQMMQSMQQANNGRPVDPMQAAMRLQQNPELMAQMLENPVMQQMMDNMLSNPEMLNAMMDMNPQLRELIERNPEIRSVFSDTRMMREHLQAMMDPQMRAMMMRNVDRAMSNLETVPGGMDALRRLHNDIQDPLWDAMQGQDRGNSGSPQTYTAQDTSQAPSAAPMSNPFAPERNAPAAPPAVPPAGYPSSGSAAA